MTITTTRRFAMLSVTLLGVATVMAGEALRATRAHEGIRVEEVWARAGIAGGNSAAYMRIVNHGGTDDRLVSAATDVADKVELHRTVMEGDRMTMQPVPAVEVPARGEAVLEPGGLHVMLIGLTRKLEEGDSFPLRLTFEREGTVELTVEVRKAGAMSHGHDGQMGHGHDAGGTKQGNN